MLEPKTHPVPENLVDDEKLKATLRKMGVALVFTVVSAVALYVMVRDNGWFLGTYIHLASTVAAAAIAAWSFYWYASRYHPRYDVLGVTVVFGDTDYFVPKHIMQNFIYTEVIEPFREVAEERGLHPLDLIKGVTVMLTPDKPTFLQLVAIGMTWPWKNYSRVWAPHVLNPGAFAYELKLHACHDLFPGRDEGEDIEWMKKKGIL